MSSVPAVRYWKSEDSLLFAQATALIMSFCLICWSVAPLLVSRALYGAAPSGGLMLLQKAALLLAGVYLGVFILTRQRVRWAVWAGFIVSALVVGAGLALLLVDGVRPIATFGFAMAGCTCIGCWLAIGALNPARIDDSRSR